MPKTSSITLKVVEVTPAVAEEWLKKNLKNRKIRQHKVDTYASQMKAGSWLLRDAIEFNKRGELVNGQHRLAAVIQAGVTVQFVVREGVDDAEVAVMDTGLSRLASDVLQMEGYKNSTTLAPAAKAVFLWRTSPGISMLRAGSTKINNEFILKFVGDHAQGLTNSVETAKHFASHFNLIPVSALAAIHFEIAEKYGSQKATEFVEQLAMGHNLNPGSPVLALRSLLLKQSTRITKPPTELKMAWTVHAFNKWINGKSNVQLIKHVEKSPFPKVS